MKYEVWMEGYAATGESGPAQLHSIEEADSFQEACEASFKHDMYFDKEKLTWWACRLFDNETDARKFEARFANGDKAETVTITPEPEPPSIKVKDGVILVRNAAGEWERPPEIILQWNGEKWEIIG